MKPWDIYTWDFPGIGPHPAVIISHQDRVDLKPEVCVLLCSSQRANRPAKAHEVLLNGADGLDWETLVKCDIIYAAPKAHCKSKRGTVTLLRRRQIAERVNA
ncbi:MAG: type II toxin-antitoxin system PemK/MazF family toxin [Verrucomicrobiales bacterium]|nr:type II toxin-antitoxin system PemK/MazF family toxin [Verrucomicrobiales bacterium]